jgi:hypothetical protein
LGLRRFRLSWVEVADQGAVAHEQRPVAWRRTRRRRVGGGPQRKGDPADRYQLPLTAWPAGAACPFAATLNHGSGITEPSLVVVKVGVGGRVSLYNAAGSSQIVVDVAGWYSG